MKDRRRTAFWVLLASGLCAFALAMGYRWFERGGAFDLDTVRVRGIRKADSTVVCEAVRPLFGTSIWQLDLGLLEERLSAIPGIDSARVRRVPLRTLILELQVSSPAFALSDGSRRTAVSTMGELLPDRFVSDTLPVVQADVPMGSQVRRSLAVWFPEVGTDTDSLLFRFDQRGISVLVNGDCNVLLGNEDLAGRWSGYTLLASSMDQGGFPMEVDMRYSGQAVLRRNGAAAAGEVTP